MPGTEGYGESARALAEQYESITFADAHRDVLRFFPAGSGRVLDIGAGSGRDAAALSAAGHHVVAVEPTAELRSEAMRRHPEAAVEWVDDMLPELAAVRARGERYDLILLSAVWMHLDPAEREAGMRSLAALIGPEGRIVMSLRHGPVPAGRRMFDVSAAETAALAATAGLRCIHRSRCEDMLGRGGVSWSLVVLEPGRS